MLYRPLLLANHDPGSITLERQVNVRESPTGSGGPIHDHRLLEIEMDKEIIDNMDVLIDTIGCTLRSVDQPPTAPNYTDF